MFYKTYLNLLKFHVLQNILKLKFHVSQKIFKVLSLDLKSIFYKSQKVLKLRVSVFIMRDGEESLDGETHLER